ncbi:MAG TPA: hypothetical protein VN363_05890 [Anaerolineales bacterium]|nr:hypothetical protein [Anaerolineales bacterium]
MDPFEPLPIPPPLEEPKRKTNTALIIVIVVLVILCCLCLVGGFGIYWLWENGDAIFNLTGLLNNFLI